MKDEKKPREWWVALEDGGFPFDIKEERPSENSTWYDDYNASFLTPNEVVHVIEKAYADKLLARIEKLREVLVEIASEQYLDDDEREAWFIAKELLKQDDEAAK